MIPEEFKYKNYLQEYTQKEGLPLPAYNAIRYGAAHPPMFLSSVVVDGVTYESPIAFPTIKAAEMNVAKVALLNVPQQVEPQQVEPQQVEPEECTIGQEELTLCKAILKEYADKINAGNPTYKTEQGDGSCLAFTTSLTFDGKEYIGPEGRNKRLSQHLAARDVIQSILDSDARDVISKIIIKSKRCNAQNAGTPAGIQTSSANVVSRASTENEPVTNVVSRASKENEPVVVNDNTVKTASATPVLAEPVSLVGASATPNLVQLVAESTSAKKRTMKAKKKRKRKT